MWKPACLRKTLFVACLYLRNLLTVANCSLRSNNDQLCYFFCPSAEVGGWRLGLQTACASFLEDLFPTLCAPQQGAWYRRSGHSSVDFPGFWGSLHPLNVLSLAFVLWCWWLTKHQEPEGSDPQWQGSKHSSIPSFCVNQALWFHQTDFKVFKVP